MDTGPYTEPYTDGDGSVAPPPPARSRRDEVYRELQHRLMVGEFALNSRLVEERIATLLGVSRTPVREALVRLLADGHVTRVNGGYFVAMPDFTDLRDLYDLRITLEMRGITRAIESDAVTHDVAILEPLRDHWRAMWDDRPEPAPDFVTLDEDFHVTLLRSSGNGVMANTLEGVNGRIRPVRMYDFLDEQRIELTITQHLKVVEAVLASKLDEAIVELRAHVGESMDEVERRVARAMTNMILHRGGMR
jgi:DNA-binding GntR family transcriptional regulator